MKYTIHYKNREATVCGFDHKSEAVNAINAIIADSEAQNDWADGDYMTVRGDGDILSYIPHQGASIDEFGNSYNTERRPQPDETLIKVLAERGKADIKVLEEDSGLDPIVVTSTLAKLVANGTAVKFQGTNEHGLPIPIWRLSETRNRKLAHHG